MALKKSDGKPYKCSHPNPITKTQEWINDYILHNCNWNNLKETQEILPVQELIEIVQKPEPEIPEPEEIVVPEPEPQIEIVYRKLEKSIEHEDAVVFHCLPVIDGKYGETFDFEGLMYAEDDLTLVFWTNIQLTVGSIVYPFVYSVKKLQYPGYRWWKVTECKEHRVGYFIHTFISEDCPDFT